MRLVSFSLAACGLSTLALSFVVTHAILSPVTTQAKPATEMSGWTTTLHRD